MLVRSWCEEECWSDCVNKHRQPKFKIRECRQTCLFPSMWRCHMYKGLKLGSRDGVARVRFPVSVICGLSLLLVLVLAPRGFSPGTPVFPSPQKPTLLNSNLIWKVSPVSALR